MEDWVIRAAVPEDEDVIASMWLRSLCGSQKARDLGFIKARDRGSDDQIAWWALNHPIVTCLVRTATVQVLCDPLRSSHEPGQPAVVWGWLVTGDEVVYGCGVKNSMQDAGVGRDIAKALLGGRLEREQLRVMELVDLHRLRLVPASWISDIQWWPTMRGLAQMALDRGSVATRVAGHILDPEREQWLPNSMRARAA